MQPRDPLVAEVASGARRLRVDPEPCLVVFGFDAFQRDGVLRAITEELRATHGLQVYAVRKPGGRTAAAFCRRANAAFDRRPTRYDVPRPDRLRPPAAAEIRVQQ